jgi:hypothetical protein
VPLCRTWCGLDCDSSSKAPSGIQLQYDIHGFSTRYDDDFHLPSAKLKLFQKGVFYSGIKTCNHLPKTIKELSHDVRQFNLALKRFMENEKKKKKNNWECTVTEHIYQISRRPIH